MAKDKVPAEVLEIVRASTRELRELWGICKTIRLDVVHVVQALESGVPALYIRAVIEEAKDIPGGRYDYALKVAVAALRRAALAPRLEPTAQPATAGRGRGKATPAEPAEPAE